MRRIAILAGLVLAACAPALSGGGHVPATGRYRYTAEYTDADTRQVRRFEGVLAIRTALPERVAGGWEVREFAPEVQLGSFVDGAYRVNADVESGGLLGTFENLVSRAGSPTELRCTGRFVARRGDVAVSHPGSCALAYLGP